MRSTGSRHSIIGGYGQIKYCRLEVDESKYQSPKFFNMTAYYYSRVVQVMLTFSVKISRKIFELMIIPNNPIQTKKVSKLINIYLLPFLKMQTKHFWVLNTLLPKVEMTFCVNLLFYFISLLCKIIFFKEKGPLNFSQ